MNVAILGGTGRQGFGLALRWAAAGVSVGIGSRDEARAKEAAARARQVLRDAGQQVTGELAGLSNDEAGRVADVVVVTVPASALEALLVPLQPHLAGKVVIDVSVSLARREGRWQAVLPGEGSTALRVRALLGGHRELAAAFHTVSSAVLADLSRELSGDDTLIFSDSEKAAETAATLARFAGLRPVLSGDLRDAATAEHLVALLLQLQQRHRRRGLGVRLTHLS
ncbi:MAG: NADPH-dependent F420 reductase [Bacillota bacterium]